MAEAAPGMDEMERPTLGERLRHLAAPQRGVMPAAGTTGPTLVLVIAAMGFLACLSLGAALIVSSAAAGWETDLTGTLTVQVKPEGTVSAEDQIEAALAILDATPGIASAQPLDSAATAALIEPWLGAGNVTETLPLPRLIDVKLEPGATIDHDALAARLNAAAPGLVLDTHRQWLDELLGAAAAARLLAFAVLAVISATTLAIVVFATRAGLSANQGVVEVLHLCGARDSFIAGEVQRHFFNLGWRGGLIGFALAALTFLIVEALSAGDALFLVAVPSLDALHYLWLLAVPALLALAVTATARLTVLRALGRMM